MKTYMHYMEAVPFNRFVFVIVGDAMEGFGAIARKFRDAVEPDFLQRMRGYWEAAPGFADFLAGRRPFCACGYTMVPPADFGSDAYVVFPRFPYLAALVHELSHAVDAVLEKAGVDDRSGEVRAYLLQDMFGHFSGELRKDMGPKLAKEWK